MRDTFAPLLSATYEDRFPPRYPVLASPKLDGIRVVVIDGVPMTRSMKKPVPSKVICGALTDLPWFDGEVIVGSEPVGTSVCANTQSGVMGADTLTVNDEWVYYVFDLADPSQRTLPYQTRLEGLNKIVEAVTTKWPLLHGHIRVLPHTVINNDKELWAYEAECVKQGYEGIMLRDPAGAYKWGRATAKSRILTKIKRWEDAEARIKEAYEEMHNENEAKINPLGRVERSSHKDNKSGTGRVGGYICETYRRLDCDLFTLYPQPGVPVELVEFDLGAAANTTQEERAKLFSIIDKLPNKVVKFKYQPTAGAERPRFPVSLIIREDE